MTNQQGATSELAPTQGAPSDGMSLQALQQHRAEVMLRRGDVRVQLQQLEERKAAAGPRDRMQFDGQIAVLRHQEMAAALDLEAIALEVERIGEAQRFATKLLVERPAEAATNRVTPPGSPSARRVPGTITPH